ncbi:hypothetical protein B5E58_04980 [Tyzzerella sp. An114]|uniref:hypothetical protein n=1 Tax=Tyzzerella sp. An114 TaxID=1965545 RepID=UPI000B43D291|nr:hypothetical protein [Tyzzerella sp. An114]OUQ59134.1 hypothetical protein B5E58_04980 [Tyzzerella sp. An114]
MIAVLMYMKNEDKNKFVPFYDKVPYKLREYIIKKRKPFIGEIIENYGTEIIYCVLPLIYGEKKSNYERWYNTVYNALEKLGEIGVTGAVLPEDDVFYSSVPVLRGRTVNAIMTFKMAKKALKIKNIDMSKAEFVVVDGNDKLTITALNSLIDNVNYLSVFTDREYFFDDIKERAEAERGLIINTFSSAKNQIFKDADVIVNCSSDMENHDYYYKRNSIYIDIVKNHSKSIRIASKRDDMMFIDGLSLKTKNGILKSQLYEGLKIENSDIFKNYIENYDNFYEVIEEFNDENISLSSLYFMDKYIL